MKIVIDIPEEEYKTLSKLCEKEKVNELSYYERIIANGIPYEEKLQGEWIYIGQSQKGLKVVECTNCHKRQYGSLVFAYDFYTDDEFDADFINNTRGAYIRR